MKKPLRKAIEETLTGFAASVLPQLQLELQDSFDCYVQTSGEDVVIQIAEPGEPPWLEWKLRDGMGFVLEQESSPESLRVIADELRWILNRLERRIAVLEKRNDA